MNSVHTRMGNFLQIFFLWGYIIIDDCAYFSAMVSRCSESLDTDINDLSSPVIVNRSQYLLMCFCPYKQAIIDFSNPYTPHIHTFCFAPLWIPLQTAAIFVAVITFGFTCTLVKSDKIIDFNPQVCHTCLRGILSIMTALLLVWSHYLPLLPVVSSLQNYALLQGQLFV